MARGNPNFGKKKVEPAKEVEQEATQEVAPEVIRFTDQQFLTAIEGLKNSINSEIKQRVRNNEKWRVLTVLQIHLNGAWMSFKRIVNPSLTK